MQILRKAQIGAACTTLEIRHQILVPTIALIMAEHPILPSKDVLEHVVDVHCHPTDEIEITDDVMNSLHIKICAMATNSNDQQRVADLVKRFPHNVWTIFVSCGNDLTFYRLFPASG